MFFFNCTMLNSPGGNTESTQCRYNYTKFHLGSYTRRMRIAPRRSAAGPTHFHKLTSHRGQAHRSKLALVKAKFFTLTMAAKRGTFDEMESIRHRVHNQRRRLEADDCDHTVCTSVTIHFQWRRCPRPLRCLAHTRPTMLCICLVIIVIVILIEIYVYRYVYCKCR